MRVLNIDLDFFIDDIAFSREVSNGRLDKKYYKPWEKIELDRFLEKQCGLNVDRPIYGRIIDNHIDVFYLMKDLIQKNKLKMPCEVIHIDAHADLGLGNGGWAYIFGELLNKPVDERTNPKLGNLGLTSGNYLLFGIACHWIDKITMVLHPKWGNEVPDLIFKNNDPNTGIIQLKNYNSTDLDVFKLRQIEPKEIEKEIEFITIPLSNYMDDGNFNYIFFCRSPYFTPESADQLIPIVEKYIKEY